MGKREVWRALQRMQKAGSFSDWRWLDISNGLALQWRRWLANISYGQLGDGVRLAWVWKMGNGWFEFYSERDADHAQPGANANFQIMIWKACGKSLQYRVE